MASAMGCLSWTHAFRYFLDDAESKQSQLQLMQGELESRTQDLWELIDAEQRTRCISISRMQRRLTMYGLFVQLGICFTLEPGPNRGVLQCVQKTHLMTNSVWVGRLTAIGGACKMGCVDCKGRLMASVGTSRAGWLTVQLRWVS